MRELAINIFILIFPILLLMGGCDTGSNVAEDVSPVFYPEQDLYRSRENRDLLDTLSHTSGGSFADLSLLQQQHEERKAEFFSLHQDRDFNNIHAALVQLYIGEMPAEQAFRSAMERINKREDGADFRMIGLIRFLYQFWDTSLVSVVLKDSVRQTVLDFKYWPDEPGIDNMCTWSENHHILFSTCEYLAGHLYRDEVFTNSGHTGAEKYERGKERILRWLELRHMTGFSEWLSNVYYTEDIAPLVALVDFSPDEDIRTKAAMVLDLMLYDMALNHFNGTFASTHGRSYFRSKTSGNRESSRSIYRLMFNLNEFDTGNMATSALAISSNYSMPAVLYEIANDTGYRSMVNLQRMGLNMDDLEKYGLDVNRLEDGMTFLSLEAYCHPKTVNLTMEMFDEYNWWENAFFKPFARRKGLLAFLRKTGLLPLTVRIFDKDLNRNTRTEVNIYTYRTPYYLLSSAQDYKKGYGGDQQAIWSAALDKEAIVFTTHPVSNTAGTTPDYWTGSGNLPRVAQFENVAIILYKISTAPGLYVTHDLEYTHAWFPVDQFDSVVQRGNWTFGAKGQAYIGLWSQKPVQRVIEGEYANNELIAEGKTNSWICEMGDAESNGSFANFMKTLSDAPLNTKGLKVQYQSPSQGYMEFDWKGSLTVEGEVVRLDKYPRYLNAYSNSNFPAQIIEIQSHMYSLFHNFDENKRASSAYMH